MGSLPVSYYVYGYVYASDDITGLNGLEVVAESVDNSSDTSTTTNNDGYYIIDLQKINDCEDGNSIKIYLSSDIDIYETFTLNLSSLFKQIDLTSDYLSENEDLLIYYNTLTGSDYICCWCSRWDINNYDVIIETWLTKTQLSTLRSNVVPGAIGELHIATIGESYYDSTWEGKNTLKLTLNPISTSNLKNMRNETTIYVKSINTSPVEGTNGYINTKIEGKTRGSGII